MLTNNKKWWIAVMFLFLGVILTSLKVSAWNPPSQTPTGGNSLGPLSVSSQMESKDGGLLLNTGGAQYGLIVYTGSVAGIPWGRVGIGTATPNGLFEIVNNSGSTLFKAAVIGTRIGIGVANPNAKLSIAGGIQVGYDSGACTSAKMGTIRWNINTLQICDSNLAWKNF